MAAATRSTSHPPLVTATVTHGGVRVDARRLWVARDGGVTLAAVEAWARHLTGDRTWAVTDAALAVAAGHALYGGASSYERSRPTDTAADAARVRAELETAATAAATAAAVKGLAAAVTAAWRDTVAAAHAGAGAAMPRSWDHLCAARAARPHPPPPDRLGTVPTNGGGHTGTAAWTPTTAGYRPRVGFTSRACTAPGCGWYLALAPPHEVGTHVADASELPPPHAATAVSIATAAAVRRGVTDATAIVHEVLGGRHVQRPSVATAAALAAVGEDAVALPALRGVVAAQVDAYRELFSGEEGGGGGDRG